MFCLQVIVLLVVVGGGGGAHTTEFRVARHYHDQRYNAAASA